jgi:hypothetical protein
MSLLLMYDDDEMNTTIGVVSHDNMIAVSAVVEDREWVPNLLLYSKLDATAVFGGEFLNECLDQYKKFLLMSDQHPELMAAFVPPVCHRASSSHYHFHIKVNCCLLLTRCMICYNVIVSD